MKPWVRLWKEKMLSSLNFQSLFMNEKALYILLYFYVRDDGYSGGLCFPDGKPISLKELTKILSGRLDEVRRIINKLVELKLLYYDNNQILCIRNYARLTINDYSLSETPNLPINNNSTITQQQPNNGSTVAQQPIGAKSLKSTRNPPIDKDKDKDKEEDKEKETKQSQIRELFEEFWLVYPRKVAKQKALIRWMNLSKKYGREFISITVPLMFKALEKQKLSKQWMKDSGEFVPHFATWLNQERWKDEVKDKEDWRDG